MVVRKEPSGHLVSIEVPHASHSTHIGSHIRWASRRTCSEHDLLPSEDRPLPNTKFSDHLVNDDWNTFYSVTSALGPFERTARLHDIALEVAYANGYDYCAELSHRNKQRSNSLRQIFVSAFTPSGRELYLSTDFEKAAGAFEVCDRNGRHIGEWLFSGRKNGNADTSGHHNIVT